MALRAGGSAPNITAFVLRESVALVSGQCGVPQWPGTTKLSRGVGRQRGHAGRPVFLLNCAARCGPVHPASPLSFCQRCSVSQCARRCCAPHRCRGVTSPVLRKCWSVRWCADMTSARWRIVLDQPSPAARPGRCVRGSCGARPLRPPASLLHNAALPSVPASRCAKAPLGAGHRCAPFG